MPSYQDIDQRLKVIEAKVEFVVKSFAVKNPLNPFGPPSTLLDIYHATNATGLGLVAPPEESTDGSVE